MLLKYSGTRVGSQTNNKADPATGRYAGYLIQVASRKGCKMDFYEWRTSDDYEAKKFRMRIAASGDDGTGDMPTEQMKAATHAYAAGIEEGRRRAALILSQLVTRGLPKGEILFR